MSRRSTDPGRGQTPNPSLPMLLLAPTILFVVALLPAHPREFVPEAFARLPLELPAIVLALLALRGGASRALRWVVVAVAGLLLALRLADLGSQLAFNRPFSPLVELHLLGDGWNLASQSIGRLEAGLAVLAVVAVLVLLGVLLFRGLGSVGRLRGTARTVTGSVSVALLVLGIAAMLLAPDETPGKAADDAPAPGAFARWSAVAGERVQADIGPDIVDRVQRMQRSIDDQRAFVVELADDPLGDGSAATFDALRGLDVALVFIESYGRSFLDGERFRGGARERLASLESTVTEAGLHVKSGWLTSPIRGGRSWLAHATFASGLTVDSQARYDRLVASPRKSLNRLFGEAGWRTAGLMPAIRYAWPEGAWYGFDDTRDFPALGYAGQPFGWVTMPDQYTLAAFETLVRAPDEQPVMAEIALISSHAPWTPLTRVVPWDDIGDGSVFDGSLRYGDTPAELFKERERVRDHFALSIDYSLEVLGGYLQRHGKGALFVVLGDHQPPSIINGWDATADVPIHIVSDDAALLARLPDALWTRGMLPADDLPSQPMRTMREALARHFSSAFDTTAVLAGEEADPAETAIRP